MDSDDEMLILRLHQYRKRKKRKQRAMYIRNIFRGRQTNGELSLVLELQQDPEYHLKYFRMSKHNFNYLLDKIRPAILAKRNHQFPIPPELRLAITLRYLASGNSQVSLAMSYRVSPSAVTKVVREVLAALCDALKDEISKPTRQTFIDVSNEFEKNWHFPNCCGAIDGKHVRVKSFANTGSSFYNYKNFFSVVLLAVVDANYKFLVVDIGSEGSMSDSSILQNSTFGRALDDGSINLPPSKPLPGTNVLAPHVILGDGGFALKKNMMKPYPRHKNLTKERRIFNYRLSRARRVSENAFGILAARWRIFHKMLECDLDLVNLIIQTSVSLHNFLLSRNDLSNLYPDQDEGDFIEGNWRELVAEDTCFSSIPTQGSNFYSQSAKQVRENFTTYFNTKHILSWQETIVKSGFS